jgi:hypothetical protein
VSTVADDDTMAGFVAAWKADTGAGGLNTLYPGGPKAGRVPAPQTMPYAGIACEQWKGPEFMAPVTAGAPYLDYRKVTLTVRAKKADAVAVLSRVKAVYGDKVPANLVIPNATVRWVEHLDQDRLAEDPARKQGEDVWQGIATYGVSTQRVVV